MREAHPENRSPLGLGAQLGTKLIRAPANKERHSFWKWPGTRARFSILMTRCLYFLPNLLTDVDGSSPEIHFNFFEQHFKKHGGKQS